ncbi:SMP-30/gluconolactonase/LRE family protein [Jiulongibacter sediminis]|jgi:gluconolactonase|uniref:SMP-30/gluconolactonase/LRE family protein n=1 Tax=Jiulongibacter sediminis TaxID=1605367 RepID=UPI0026EAA625|nr:SMP-30/gluconolactonase/LRE family protein [Jiulongibacter sediminis]
MYSIKRLFSLTIRCYTCLSAISLAGMGYCFGQSGSQSQETKIETLAEGLGFPEGPIALADGSVLVVEMQFGNLTKIGKDGTKTVIAKLGGGPNGAAMGPDGAVYVCNNGGLQWSVRNGVTFPGEAAKDYKGGYIQRVDLQTGNITTLYSECEGRKLSAPNDIVFDAQGGMWISDQGKYFSTHKEHGSIYYAKTDGSFISRQAEKLETPNGIRLSADGKSLYYAETNTGRLFSYQINTPGEIDTSTKKLVIGLPGQQMFDSFALDEEGNLCVATLLNGGISIVSKDGKLLRHIPTQDILTTSICFGGNQQKTAYITLGGAGKLISIPWNKAGLKLNFLTY